MAESAKLTVHLIASAGTLFFLPSLQVNEIQLHPGWLPPHCDHASRPACLLNNHLPYPTPNQLP